MKLTPVIATLASACGLVSNTAHASATSWDPSWNLSGFGTVGYTVTDTDVGLYTGPGQPGGASKEGTLGVDSKIGAQINGKANDVFSATVQAISQRSGEGNFKPSVEWMFVKAQLSPNFSLRVGRIGAPLFVVSDFRSIGYSTLWLRTPIDVYGQVPFSHFDGGDAIYQNTLGSVTLTAQVYGGKSDSASNGMPVHVKKEFGLNLNAEFDNGLTLRVGRVQGKLTVDNATVNHLLALIRTTPFASVADQMDADGKDASFTGVGVAYDQGNWIANAEYTKRKTSSYVSSTTGWEATLGYRVGKFTPYATLSQIKRDSSNVVNTIPTTVPQLAPLAAGVNTVLFNQNLAQKTDSIGVRWDAWKNIDVKAQYDRIRPSADGAGLFNRVKTTLPSSVNVYSVAVDFVF